jgi:hypothetical protein
MLASDDVGTTWALPDAAFFAAGVGGVDKK